MVGISPLVQIAMEIVFPFENPLRGHLLRVSFWNQLVAKVGNLEHKRLQPVFFCA